MSRIFGSSLVAALLLVGGASVMAAAAPAVNSGAAEAIPVETPADGAMGGRGRSDAAVMLLIGTVLIGLASAVRRTA